MRREDIRAALDDRTALICTLLGECASEPIDGQVAVASVIRNRATHPRWWGRGVAEVCLREHQFSCWWERNANTDRVYALAEALLRGTAATGSRSLVGQLQWIAVGVIDDILPDASNGADHYLTGALLRSPQCPAWATGKPLTAEIGGHVFMRLEI